MNQSQGTSTADDRIQRGIENIEETNKKQEQRIRNLETKAVQNVNLYFIFQAVILNSTTTTTCRHWWVPFSLSLLAAITNMLSLWANMFNVLKSREELDQNILDLAFIRLYQMTREEINQVLPGATFNHQGGEIVRPKPSPVKKWKRGLLVYLSIGLFVGFSAVVMYGCYRILCNPGDRKCVKLC